MPHKIRTESPSADFTHIVLTRFNVAVEYASSTRGIESQWLHERLALFMRYCLPAVGGQEDAHFHWLVFCNAASPDWFKEKMAGFAESFTTVYVDGISNDAIIAKKVMESGYVTAPYLITTRIDNDDSISRRHLCLVQSAFRRQQREFLVFPFGLQSFRGHLYQVYWANNPFLSLIEKVCENGEITTVLCVPHTDVRQAGKVRNLWGPAHWLQVLHESNVGNSLRGWPTIQSRFHPNFDVDWPRDLPADTFYRRICFYLCYVCNRGRRVFGRVRKNVGKKFAIGPRASSLRE
jgi:Putative rhamnosyl transferase